MKKHNRRSPVDDLRKSLYGFFMALLIRVLLLAVVIYWFFIRPMRRRRRIVTEAPRGAAPASPYQVLGVDPNAGWEEIKKAYHKELSRYHPDKVEHLGAEIQRVAKEKTLEIRQAFESIKQKQKM